MSNNASPSPASIGFPGLLAILFIGLKLTGHIDWSWWWVLSPLWLSFGIFLVILAVCFAIAVIGDRRSRRNYIRRF